MNLNIEHKIIMIPTESGMLAKCIKNNVYAEKIGDLVTKGSHTTANKSNDVWEHQHLYIISENNNIIESGNWYIDDTNRIRQSVTSDETYWSTRKDYKKIIGTTDIELIGVHQIPKDMIKEYIKSGVITEL